MSAKLASKAAETAGRNERAWIMLAALAFAAGCFLRLWGLSEQVVVDDEWHVLHKVLRSPMLDIVSQLDYADFSIPIAVYLRWLADHGGISEWGLRLPMVIAGCLLVLAAPLVAPPGTRWSVRATWALLIAVSPLLVFVSRIGRPYAITALLCTIALFAFPRWLADRSRTWAVGYVAATVLSAWLHLITLAFALMPFAFFGLRALVTRDRATFARIAKLGLATILPLAVVLGPPLARDWFMFTAKAGVDDPTLEGLYRALLMLAGSAEPLVLGALAIAGFAGAVAMARQDRVLTFYLLSTVLVGTLAILAARPNWIQQPQVFARYVAPVLPILLLFAAHGIVLAASELRARLRVPAIALTGVLLVLVGPLPAQAYRPNQFAHHLRFQFDYDDAHNPYVQRVPADPVPAFYGELSRAPPGSLTLIEMPWRLESHFNPHVWYQRVHRQNVLIGLVTPVCGSFNFGEYPENADLRLRQMAHLRAILRGETYGADFLVVHRKPWRMGDEMPHTWPDMAKCLATIETALGPPVYRDAQIVVFALPRR
ncbi:MAG: hypothetical protein IT518_05370 [Burkholderiales bacterium]|nr:hypothetical protein [Burkholderiales bacterium]